MFKFSAEDIANQSFQARFRGYDPDQVHEFLEGLARDWGEAQNAVRKMSQELEEQTRELRDYRRREKSLVEALEMARQMAEEIRHQADRDAELVLAETELKAERMLSRAQSEVMELRNELFDLQQVRARFHNEMEHMLKNYRTLLEHHEERSRGQELHPLPPIPGASQEKFETQEIDAKEIVDEKEVEGTDLSASA